MTEFKSSISKAFKNMTFFDYLYIVNRKPNHKGDKEHYPNFITEIAGSNTQYLSKLDED